MGGGVEIKPTDSMTYLGIILDQKLNWSLHIKTKVSKAIKWLAILKPAINYIYGLSPARMLWIYKQILLPRLPMVLMYGVIPLHENNNMSSKHWKVLPLGIFAQIWRTTPTASL